MRRRRLTARDPPPSGGGAVPPPQVCGYARLLFEPPTMYCMLCGQRIKRGQVYYGTPPEYENKGCWCHACYTDIKGEFPWCVSEPRPPPFLLALPPSRSPACPLRLLCASSAPR